MFNSLKSRGLAAGLVFLCCILLVAFYGQSRLHNNLQLNNESSTRINQLSRFIDRLDDTLHRTESSLFQFLLGLEPADKRVVQANLRQLELLLPRLYQQPMVARHSRLQISIDRIDYLQGQLSEQVHALLAIDHRLRLATTQLLLERMSPVSDRFELALAGIDERLTKGGKSADEHARAMVQRLTTIWNDAQADIDAIISSHANRRGTAQATREMLANNAASYSARLEAKVQALYAAIKGRPTYVAPLRELTFALSERLELLAVMQRSLAQQDWRYDKYLFDRDIAPVMTEIGLRIDELTRHVTGLAAANLARSEYEAAQLSRFLWLLAFFFMALILSTYLVFEHWIRVPVDEVARAMLLESSQPSDTALQRIGAHEIDGLIDAFETMRAQIRQRQQRITSILENAGEGIVLIDQRRRIDSFNRSAERIFGCAQHEVIGRFFLRLFDAGDSGTIERILALLDDDTAVHHQFLVQGRRLSDQRSFPVDLTLSPIRLEDQLCHILVMRDATERINNENDLHQAREQAETSQQMLSEQVEQLFESLVELNRTQKQLVESEKMASLAGLVAGVAHEINTPIGIGVTAASHLHSELTDLQQRLQHDNLAPEQINEYLEDSRAAARIIENNLQQAAMLISSFKQVAVDQSSAERRRFNLREYLDEVIMNLRPRLKKTRHRLALEVDPHIELQSVPGALSQVLTNLVMNSLQHGFDAGQAGLICIRGSSDGDSLVLRYQDNGGGMSRETRHQIFEPFYTTRRGSGGSGLGMHITYNLVTTTLRGSIKCVSRPGIGARFVMRIPLTI